MRAENILDYCISIILFSCNHRYILVHRADVKTLVGSKGSEEESAYFALLCFVILVNSTLVEVLMEITSCSAPSRAVTLHCKVPFPACTIVARQLWRDVIDTSMPTYSSSMTAMGLSEYIPARLSIKSTAAFAESTMIAGWNGSCKKIRSDSITGRRSDQRGFRFLTS